MFREALLILVLSSVPSASAPEEGNSSLRNPLEPSLTFQQCIDRAEGITLNLNNCIGVEQDRLERELKRTYRDRLRRLSGSQSHALRRSQREWLRWRQPHCEKEIDPQALYWGTMEVLQFKLCLVHVTAQRLVWLREHPQHGR